MAIYDKLDGVALDAYRKMVKDLKAKAMKELNLSEDQIVVRQLRPQDLGVSNSSAHYGAEITANTWSTIVNTIVGDNKFIGIYGFVIRASLPSSGDDLVPTKPILEQIRITREGSIARYYNVKPINFFSNGIGYVDDPVTISQNTGVTIEGFSMTSSTLTGNFDIVGVVVEKKGMTIYP
ncbi:MAG: hypothetical protein QXI58_06765 [Candidatus Micrarchaeia archaeon]